MINRRELYSLLWYTVTWYWNKTGFCRKRNSCNPIRFRKGRKERSFKRITKQTGNRLKKNTRRRTYLDCSMKFCKRCNCFRTSIISTEMGKKIAPLVYKKSIFLAFYRGLPWSDNYCAEYKNNFVVYQNIYREFRSNCG